MAGRKIIHVVPVNNGEWKVIGQKAERAVKICEDKSDAIALAKEIAKNASLGQVIIHDAKGKIQTEYTYGKDPVESKG
jgi:hypothetical protein